MILDARTMFSASGDFANEIGTANVGDQIDLGVADADVGNGQPVYLVINVETAADGGATAGATVAFQVVSDGVATPATDGNQTIHFTTKPHVAGNLTAGATFVYPLPVSGLAYERYLGLQLVTAVEGEDALVASAHLTLDPHGWRAMPDGVN